jgi:hypothetical protein
MVIYFESDMGCGIRDDYRTLKSAEAGIRREVGWANSPKNIRKATKEDLAQVASMGGWVPKGKLK